MICLQHLIYIVSVEEFLFQTEAESFYAAVSVETCDLLTKSAVENAVFKSDDNIVIGFQTSWEWIRIIYRDITMGSHVRELNLLMNL